MPICTSRLLTSQDTQRRFDLMAIPEIRPEQSVELLKELHILTRDGKLNQDSRRKLKQVYHLFHFIEPLLQEVFDATGDLTLADHGAGKSYLGFILYDLFLKSRQAGHVYGIETREELVTRSRELAEKLGFARMSFLNLSVEDSITSPELPAQVDVVTALHACNTATDDAIRFAPQAGPFIVLVPCCQAEVAMVLNRHKNASFGKTPLSEIWRHPIHTREFGSQLTNVLRCLQLEAPRLPTDRDRTGRLGTFDEERTLSSPARPASRKRVRVTGWRRFWSNSIWKSCAVVSSRHDPDPARGIFRRGDLSYAGSVKPTDPIQERASWARTILSFSSRMAPMSREVSEQLLGPETRFENDRFKIRLASNLHSHHSATLLVNRLYSARAMLAMPPATPSRRGRNSSPCWSTMRKTSLSARSRLAPMAVTACWQMACSSTNSMSYGKFRAHVCSNSPVSPWIAIAATPSR